MFEKLLLYDNQQPRTHYVVKYNNSKVHRLSERSTYNIINIIGKWGLTFHKIIWNIQ